jgi:C4-dicarboxylate-specific signal transduction histidine kinase
MEKTKALCGVAAMEIEVNGDEKNAAVYVDAHQVSQSVAFILANALQSYKGENGPVWIECAPAPTANAVWVAIRDRGCGMDAETRANACQPFYSAALAGRRRGMGLARAQRMLLLNGGDLKLASEPDHGTTVTVTLPKV